MRRLPCLMMRDWAVPSTACLPILADFRSVAGSNPAVSTRVEERSNLPFLVLLTPQGVFDDLFEWHGPALCPRRSESLLIRRCSRHRYTLVEEGLIIRVQNAPGGLDKSLTFRQQCRSASAFPSRCSDGA